MHIILTAYEAISPNSFCDVIDEFIIGDTLIYCCSVVLKFAIFLV